MGSNPIWSSDFSAEHLMMQKLIMMLFLTKTHFNQSTKTQDTFKNSLKPVLNGPLKKTAILMFKVKHGICPTYISDLFYLQYTQYSLRNSEFVIPRFNTVTYGNHSIKYLGPTLWRRLPRGTRSASTLSQFKKLVRQMDLSKLISNECGPDCFLCSS